jgi:signal transduction histidine kinase/DNA-binding NarL/FixJ family response regulator/HAMP domain-containing protein
MEQINVNIHNTFVLHFVALVMATYIGILTARWVGNPIMQLDKSTKKIAKGRWELIPDERADELGELAKSFETMAKQLQESFVALETKNKDLQVLNAAVLASESRLYQFLEAMPMGVFIVEADGKPYYINQIGKQILLSDLIPEAKIEDLVRLYQFYIAGTEQLYPSDRLPITKALQGETSSVDDIEIHHHNRIVAIEITAMPIYDKSGEITFAIATFTDTSQCKQQQHLLSQSRRTLETQVKKRTIGLLQLINQFKTTQQELIRSQKIAAQGQKAAEQANKAKSEFLASMSHELRTPLNAILGFTQLMSRDNRLNSEHQQNLSIINRAGEHLLNLINDILEMSKIEAGHSILNLSNFDLIWLLNNLKQMLHLRANAKGLTLTFEYQPGIERYIQTDASKLRQVLLNLLGNAIKFTQTGSVTLRVSGENRGLEGVDAVKEVDDSVFPISPTFHTFCFEVKDTGSGISSDEIELLFEPFGQTETGRQSQQGTGLGLAISRKYIQLMGGDITVHSTVGAGSQFTFYIQANLVSKSEILGNTKQQIISLELQQQYRILVVDDAHDSRLFLVKLLTSIGFLVREASNGVDAISQWSEWQPHLILMDMRMPIMDGYAATREIKARQQKIFSQCPSSSLSPQTIIIALTASVFEEERHNILLAGCDDVVRKPFIEELLLEKVCEYLGVKYISQIKAINPDEAFQKIQIAPSIADIELFLSQMPQDWRKKIYDAAASCSDDLIFDLLPQIPDGYAPIIRVFRDLANNYEFEKIMELTRADAG